MTSFRHYGRVRVGRLQLELELELDAVSAISLVQSRLGKAVQDHDYKSYSMHIDVLKYYDYNAPLSVLLVVVFKL